MQENGIQCCVRYPQLKRIKGVTIPFLAKYLIIASLKKKKAILSKIHIRINTGHEHINKSKHLNNMLGYLILIFSSKENNTE